mmetsp:Transcript_7050/g.8089  ORF Transcript_7050/g.8089 Transcript_7050/m.8089 type:complete len:240 (+) Transcript_7050:1387-2106(+)
MASQDPPSAFLSWKPPAMAVGTISRSTGRDPSNISKRERPRIPVNTLVGQSGPPTRIATLGVWRPGFSRIFLMARMEMELTPTNLRMLAFSPIRSPIPFCWHTIAHNLMTKQNTPEIASAGGKPRSSSTAEVKMIPPVRYTGTPGTGGRRNIPRPTAKKMANVIPALRDFSSPASQLKKMVVALPIPICSEKKITPTQSIFTITLAQFHPARLLSCFAQTAVTYLLETSVGCSKVLHGR